ncbi:MAG TPA: hypothetical protein VGJ18_20050 [Gemmatimonadaceae bacterium]|jgi:hypothetical protein
MHARFSRWIGPLPERQPGVTGWLVLTAIAGGLLALLLAQPVPGLSILAAFDAATLLSQRMRRRWVCPMTNDRVNEDIGSLARAFDRRAADPLDPWAIRAVWNAMMPLTELNGWHFPLRPSDRFDDDLGLDSEEIEYLIPALVEQCERVPGEWEANPYYRRLRSVGDLVHFISAQPLRRSAMSART